MKPRDKKICETCKSEFTPKWKYLLKTRKFCSHKCKGLAMVGKKISEEAKEKLRKLRLGQKLPQVVKDKISATRKKLLDEGKLKIVAGNKGKKHTQKTKDILSRKMSLSYEDRYGDKAQEERMKRSLALKGKKKPWQAGANHPWWKGGITPINKAVRTSLEYNIWRDAVYRRDNYTCVWCGERNRKGVTVKLNADHIKPFAYYPELRFAIDNGRTLCVPCHKKTDTYGNKKQKKG